ncbi:MAG: formate C-acetyltransferase/glycerol dehydratase family glycyl radical enzyme [Clostridia bacterium]|nr:formate C-acetyltransferase/glycerol dehydratase family glycyl radical enzyme [Clostridia bacterium]
MFLTEIDALKPSQRVKRIKQRFLNARPTMCCNRAMIYTRVYQENQAMPVVLKRAVALRATLEEIPIFIEPDELIVGHPSSLPRSAEVFPDVNISFMEDIDCFDTREYNRLHVSDEVKSLLREIEPYWIGKTPHYMQDAMRTDELRSAVRCGLLSDPHEWSGFAHVAMDYRKLLSQGVSGIIDEINERLNALKVVQPDFAQKRAFYLACQTVCLGMLAYADRYRRLAEDMAEKEPNEIRRAELKSIAGLLDRVPSRPCETFREAIQSFWFMQLIPQIESNGFSITPGRFDQYMWPYLENDIRAGRITWEEAQELVDLVFLKCSEIMRVDSNGAAEVNAGYAAGQNLVVGGCDAAGEDATNPLSIICLRANHHVRMHQPNFTARLHKNSPDSFVKAVVESISCGNGMPQVLNDEVIIPALVKKRIPLEEAREYIPVGCDEITVNGMWGRCNGGYVNLAKVLEAALNDGTDPMRNERLGLALDASSCGSFEAFMAILDKQLDNAFEMQVCEANLTDYVHSRLLPLPFVSVFVDNCLEKGMDVTQGGARYNTTGLVAVGIATFADSLHAVRELAFGDHKRLALSEFRDILRSDFKDQEFLRQYIINRLPKFGNDIDEVDELAVYVTERFFNAVDNCTNWRGGDFWCALYSVSAQVGLGNYTGATPDGRLSRRPLSDGLTPMYGMDVSGPTAAMNSITKVALENFPNGVIVNQRLVPTLFETEKNRAKVAYLLRYFVDKGGFHWQFNIVDNKTLIAARKDPDAYRSLVVRVAGYSAVFVELSEKAQDSIILRYASDL